MEKYTDEDLQAQGYKPVVKEYFTGKAWLKSFVMPDEHTNCIISDVLFEPGARNNWHTHPSNQILIVKEGTCYYQEEGKPIQKINAGGVINILPGIRHWRGAPPDSTMIHTAIGINTEKGIVNWENPVTDEEYSSYE